MSVLLAVRMLGGIIVCAFAWPCCLEASYVWAVCVSDLFWWFMPRGVAGSRQSLSLWGSMRASRE